MKRMAYFFMVKVERQGLAPCQALCDISTNKRYRAPTGGVYVASCYEHAEKAYAKLWG